MPQISPPMPRQHMRWTCAKACLLVLTRGCGTGPLWGRGSRIKNLMLRFYQVYGRFSNRVRYKVPLATARPTHRIGAISAASMPRADRHWNVQKFQEGTNMKGIYANLLLSAALGLGATLMITAPTRAGEPL